MTSNYIGVHNIVFVILCIVSKIKYIKNTLNHGINFMIKVTKQKEERKWFCNFWLKAHIYIYKCIWRIYQLGKGQICGRGRDWCRDAIGEEESCKVWTWTCLASVYLMKPWMMMMMMTNFELRILKQTQKYEEKLGKQTGHIFLSTL